MASSAKAAGVPSGASAINPQTFASPRTLSTAVACAAGVSSGHSAARISAHAARSDASISLTVICMTAGSQRAKNGITTEHHDKFPRSQLERCMRGALLSDFAQLILGFLNVGVAVAAD